MLRRFGFALLFAIVAYPVGGVVGYFLVQALSSNTHDRAIEAAMTGAFFSGPLAALVGFVGGFVFGGRRRIAPR